MQRVRQFGVLIMMVSLPAMGQADAVHGLMWNRTGLPAVFPLQVKTQTGADYFLTLSDAQTGAPALAAYIEGGRHFRVLVPPGVYDLRFAYGADWQGKDALFGSDGSTQEVDLGASLTFAVKTVGVKGGYTLDLRELSQGKIDVAPLDVCQSYRFAGTQRARSELGRAPSIGTLPDALEFYETPLERLAAEQEVDRVSPQDNRQRRKAAPRIEVRTRVCD